VVTLYITGVVDTVESIKIFLRTVEKSTVKMLRYGAEMEKTKEEHLAAFFLSKSGL
jgi:hypothetical protein